MMTWSEPFGASLAWSGFVALVLARRWCRWLCRAGAGLLHQGPNCGQENGPRGRAASAGMLHRAMTAKTAALIDATRTADMKRSPNRFPIRMDRKMPYRPCSLQSDASRLRRYRLGGFRLVAIIADAFCLAGVAVRAFCLALIGARGCRLALALGQGRGALLLFQCGAPCLRRAALGGIFPAVARCDMRRIAVEIGAPDSELFLVLVDPLPQDFAVSETLHPRVALHAHEIDRKAVAVAAAAAAAVE